MFILQWYIKAIDHFNNCRMNFVNYQNDQQFGVTYFENLGTEILLLKKFLQYNKTFENTFSVPFLRNHTCDFEIDVNSKMRSTRSMHEIGSKMKHYTAASNFR